MPYKIKTTVLRALVQRVGPRGDALATAHAQGLSQRLRGGRQGTECVQPQYPRHRHQVGFDQVQLKLDFDLRFQRQDVAVEQVDVEREAALRELRNLRFTEPLVEELSTTRHAWTTDAQPLLLRRSTHQQSQTDRCLPRPNNARTSDRRQLHRERLLQHF